MFRNALFNPSNNTPSSSMSPRRHSHFDVSLSPRLAYRRSTMPVIDVSGMSPGLGYMNTGPSTPCFVTPTLGAFSGRRFSFDSPLQTLTAMSSAGLPTINRKAAKRAWAKMSPKRMSRTWKMFMILLLISFAGTLFLIRKSNEISVPVQMQELEQSSCSEETGICETREVHYHENNPKEEFMELVSQTDKPHLEEDPSDLWQNRWALQDMEEMTDSKNTESEILALPNESSKLDVPSETDSVALVPKQFVDTIKTFIRDTLSGDSKTLESESNKSEDQLKPLEDVPSEESVVNNSPEPEESPLQVVAQVLQAEIKPEQMQSGSLHHPAAPQPQAEQFMVPKPDVVPPPPGPPQPLHPHGQGRAPQQQLYHKQAGMNGMLPPPPPGYLEPQGNGFPPAPARLQQHAHAMQHSQGLPPPPRHGLPPGVNPDRYNQQYPHPQVNYNPDHRFGHNPPHVYQANHDQRRPPGVNPP